MKRFLVLTLGLLVLEPGFSPVAGENREARYLSFSVRDKNGIYLRDLKLKEVALFLDKEPVEIRFFGYRNVPAALVFLIENSPRTAKYSVSIPQLGQINIVDIVRYHLVDELISAAAENGEILLGEFYKELEVLHDFSDDDYLLIDLINRMKPKANYIDKENIPVGRMLGRGVDLLRDRPEKRKILVLFTTTIDRESIQSLEEYQQMFRFSDIDLYVVSFALASMTGPGHTHNERVNRLYFRKLVGETSGRFYLAGEYVFPDEFMNDLLTTLTNSYTIGFYIEPGSEPAERSVEIRIDRPKCRITHRKRLIF